jgi:capsular polysaccharide biosynthesis protein
VSITKKLVEAGAAGLLIGLLVSALIVTGLTWADRTARDAADVRRVLGLEVAASIEQIPGGTVTSTPAGET